MASVAQLVKRIAEVTEANEGTVRLYARQLLEDYILPGSVGRRVAQVEPLHVALLLIAVMTLGKARDATRYVRVFGNMTSGGLPKEIIPTPEGAENVSLDAKDYKDPKEWARMVEFRDCGAYVLMSRSARAHTAGYRPR